MCHVAAEMERQGFELPLMIGGATTSRVHTAVKIHPNYRRGQTVYVNDASRAVGVAQALMSRDEAHGLTSPNCAANTPASPPRMRARRRTRRGCRSPPRAPMRSSSTGRAPTCRRSRPSSAPRRCVDYPIAELVEFIDWTPFFQTWELTGKFPAILDDAKVGEAARSLYDDAHAMLDKIVAESWFKANAVRRLLAGERGGRRHRCSMRDETRDERRSRCCTRCASNCPSAKAAPTSRCRFRRAARQRACTITSAPSPSPPASARTRSPTASSAPTTTTPPSW